MELNLNQTFMDANYETITFDEKPLTLRDVLRRALLADFEDEKNLSGEIKQDRWDLAYRIKNAGDTITFKIEELTEIKRIVSKAYGTIIVGQARHMLEGS